MYSFRLDIIIVQFVYLVIVAYTGTFRKITEVQFYEQFMFCGHMFQNLEQRY